MYVCEKDKERQREGHEEGGRETVSMSYSVCQQGSHVTCKGTTALAEPVPQHLFPCLTVLELSSSDSQHLGDAHL